MNILNLSSINEGLLYSWLPHDLRAEKIVFFPDACPGKSPLPTGTTVLTKQEDWRKYTLSDIGCGMLLIKTKINKTEFTTKDWDSVYSLLKNNTNSKGHLGSGNHFLTAYSSNTSEVYFLIHTGSRLEGKEINSLIDNPIAFNREYSNVIEWAKENRIAIKELIDKVFGKSQLILDTVHNSFEETNEGVIIRKGSVKLNKNDISVIPSNMDGEMILIKATENIDNALNSISHGTGRVMSRGEAKKYAEIFDYEELRNRIYIPNSISNDSIKTEAPFCYRNLDECMSLISEYVIEIERFNPFAYIGQL
ncbi:MAG: ligase RtcB family protein [Clostridiaceae bacterium]|jgi:RNA-splicing ligase RtcB|nr:ligase RtcB family protein [Clostridiaceae bacterium]